MGQGIEATDAVKRESKTDTVSQTTSQRRERLPQAQAGDPVSFLDLLANLPSRPQPATQSKATAEPLVDQMKEAVRSELLNNLAESQVKAAKTETTQPGSETKPSSPAHDSKKSHGADSPIRLSKEETSEWKALWLNPNQPLPTGLPIGLNANGLGIAQEMAANANSTIADNSRMLMLQEKWTNLMQKAQQLGRPIRVDLDEQLSLLLRIRQGKVSAEWVANGTQAQGKLAALAAQVQALKQRMQEADLPVEDLHVRQDDAQSQNSHSRQQQQGSEQETS